LERARHGRARLHLKVRRATLVRSVRRATALPTPLQALQRPFFIEKPRDIVGPYLNPPDYAVGLCMDEKSQINAVVERYNADASPFALVATAESIVGKIDFAH